MYFINSLFFTNIILTNNHVEHVKKFMVKGKLSSSILEFWTEIRTLTKVL